MRIPKLPLEGDEAKGSVNFLSEDETSSNFHGVFKFLEDTGASMPRLYEEDVATLYAMCEQPAPFLCYMSFLNASGRHHFEPTCLFEITLNDPDLLTNQYKLPRPFVAQQCAVSDGICPDPLLRLSGSWLRQFFYVATVPNNKKALPPRSKWPDVGPRAPPEVAARFHQNSLYVAETYTGLSHIMPRRDVTQSGSSPPDISDAASATNLNPNSSIAKTWVLDGVEYGPLAA